MNCARLAKILIEGLDVPEKEEVSSEPGGRKRVDKGQIDKKVAVYLNRLLLRIFSMPALMSFLADVALFQDDQSKNDGCTIQLDFLRLPEEVYPQLITLCAAPRPPKMLKYVKSGSARTGVQLEVRPDDFPGSEYSYSS